MEPDASRARGGAMNISHMATWLLAGIVAAAPQTEPTWTTVNRDGTTTLRLLKPSVVVEVVAANKPLPCTAYGPVKGYTKSGVVQLRISVDGRDLFIPYSLAACLWGPDRARLEQTKDDVLRLTLVGGDGFTGYLLVVEFDRQRVRRRTIEDEVSGHPAEETIYRQDEVQ